MGIIHEQMQNEIESVIANEIPQGFFFDAHAVIEFIARNNKPLYLEFCDGKEGYGEVHGRMSRILTLISERPNNPIEVVGKSWSADLNGGFGNMELKCFKKL